MSDGVAGAGEISHVGAVAQKGPFLRRESRRSLSVPASGLGEQGVGRYRTSGLRRIAGALIVLATVASVSLSAWAVPPASATVTVTSHFIQTATSSNLFDGFLTEINNAATNGNPNAILFVTTAFNSGGVCGCVAFADPVAVFYVPGHQKWAIADAFISNNIPIGAEFNVLVVQNPSNSVFTATATSSNIAANGFTLSKKSTVGKGAALLQVTQNYTPGGHLVPSINPHTPGVVYGSGPNGNLWDIQNLDNASMPTGAAYNVIVGSGASNGGKAVLLTGNSSNTAGIATVISNNETNGNPNAVVFETQNFDPSLNFGTNFPHQTGVGYANSPTDQEYVVALDGAAMPTTTHYFNLLIFGS